VDTDEAIRELREMSEEAWLGPEGPMSIIFRKEVGTAEDPEAEREQLVKA